MKAEKLRELSDDELATREKELEEEIFRLRLKKETGQLDQPSRLRAARKDLARVKTLLGERRRAAAVAGDAARG